MAGADAAPAKSPLASAHGFSRSAALWADLLLLFIVPKENNSGKNLIFLRTALVTPALQLQGVTQKRCWLCPVCSRGGAPAQGVGNQQAADRRSAPDQRAGSDSPSSPALTCRNSRGLWVCSLKGTFTSIKHTRFGGAGTATPPHPKCLVTDGYSLCNKQRCELSALMR